MALCCVSIGTLLQTQIALRLEVCFLLFCWPVYQKMKIEGVVEVNEWEIISFRFLQAASKTDEIGRAHV